MSNEYQPTNTVLREDMRLEIELSDQSVLFHSCVFRQSVT